MAQMYVYSYEQLLAIVNQQATTIAQRDAVINNLRIEREWLEEDNKLQREEVEKANKKIADQERFGKLREKRFKKDLLQVKESQDQIKRKHQNAVRELNDLKGKNLKIKAHCTSLLDKLDKSTQELQQKQEELDRTKQELDLGYSVGESMYQHLRYYYWGYFDLLKYFQWPGLPTGGATVIELDTNDKVTPMEEHAIAVLPHSYSVTEGVRVLPKPTSETVIVPAPMNTVKEPEGNYRTILVAQNVIQSFRRNTICPLNHSPARDLNPIEFLLCNNNICSFILQAPEVAQLSAVHSEVPTIPGNHLQLFAICPPEWANAANTIVTIPTVKAANRAPRLPKITTLTNITSCNKTFGSFAKKSEEEHQRGRWTLPAEPKGGHCQSTTASFEHRPDANNLFTDGEKEALTRKDERRRTGEKKSKTLVSWLKNYRYSAKLNWPKIVSVDKLMKILGV